MFNITKELSDKICVRMLMLKDTIIDDKVRTYSNTSGCDSCSGYCDPGCGQTCEASGSN